MALIAIAEDDPSSRLILETLVEQAGHTPLVFGDGQAAWNFLQHNGQRVALVITDLMMPEMDGAALIKTLRAHKKTADIPVIVQSAYIGVNGIASLLDIGANAVLPKPIDNKELQSYLVQFVKS